MPETWPSDVPYAPKTGSLKIVQPFRPPDRTDMEDGQQRGRRSTSKNIAKLQFTINMPKAAFVIFKAWVRDTLIDGVLRFEMPIWTGAAYETRLCRFTDSYQNDVATGFYQDVSMTLDVEDY